MQTEPNFDSHPALVKTISDWLVAHLEELDERYRWPWPDKTPVGIERDSEESLANTNRRLRAALSKQWHDENSESRAELAKWYVAIWGGIRANKSEKIAGYATNPVDEVQKNFSGIASWSKVLAMRDPSQFAIYDSWVALSLNSIQLLEYGRLSVAFPLPPWRRSKEGSGLREQAAKRIKDHPSYRTAEKLASSQTYRAYLALLRKAVPPAASIEKCEMILFASGNQLARSLLASPEPTLPLTAD